MSEVVKRKATQNVIYGQLPTEAIEFKRCDDPSQGWKLGEAAPILGRKDLPVLEMTNASLHGGPDRGYGLIVFLVADRNLTALMFLVHSGPCWNRRSGNAARP